MTRREAMMGAAAAMVAAPAIVAAPAFAHREKMTTTLVEWTGEGFAVTHSFHRHDAEVALSRAGLIDRPEIDSLRSRALVALHVEETFGIEGLELVTLGAETEGNRVYVFQEASAGALPEELRVRASMLRGLWADQINAVDVKVGRDVRSLRFAGDDGVKAVTLGA